MPRVLIIEDDHALAAALAVVVRRLGAEPVAAASGQGGLEKARRGGFDAVLLDIGLPDISGLKVLDVLRGEASPPPVVVLTAHGTLEHALEARRLGAHEYFLKPVSLPDLQGCLRALLTAPAASATPVVGAELMIGATPEMQRAFAVLAQACATREPVLITGPAGSGKTLAAEILARHGTGGGEARFFRCDEWPEAEARAELRRLLQEEGGSLRVEEVARLPLPLQADLAQALQRKGGPRLLATTSADLPEAISAGRFREDLYYQIGVLQLRLPALAARTEDIPALAAHLLKRAAPGRELALDPATLAMLKGHDWPGNVRELEAAMRHAAAVCVAPVVLPHHLPPELAAARVPAGVALEAALDRALLSWLDYRLSATPAPDYDTLLAEVERRMLADLLRRHEGRPTHLATALGLNRATLRKRLRELGLGQ
jgi:DNA-binding NtrC family response regulator